MFGFSLQKLLVLALIIAAVWYGFKLIGRLDRARRQKLARAARHRDAGPGTPPAGGAEDTIDLVRSADGKTYVAPDRGRDRR